MKNHSPYKKPYRIKKKKSILKSRFFWFSIFFVILCIGIFYLIYLLPFIQIKEINVSNNNKVSTDEVKNLAWHNLEIKILFFDSKSILLLDTNKIKNSIIEKYPQIEKIIVKRILPDKLSIEIKEREPYGLFCKDDTNCWYFDKTGVAFEWIQNNLLPMTRIEDLSYGKEVNLGDKVINKDFLGKINNTDDKIINDLKINIEQFVIPSQGRLNVQTTDGWEIYFDPDKDLNWQLIELETVLQREIPPDKLGTLEYIDLRFSKVFYKFK